VNSSRQLCNNDKEPEYKDPTVYFNLIVSLDIDLVEIIACTSYKWTQTNGQHIQVKEFQGMTSKTVVSFFKLSTETHKAVIIAKFMKILIQAQKMVVEEDNEYRFKFDWSMNLNVPINHPILIFTLMNQVGKL
jgi:hypothetical protein